MATKAISGVELWHNTELGKALRKVLPRELTRVIIDIGIDSPVRIYYASLDTGPIVDLKWDEIIERCEIVKPVDSAIYPRWSDMCWSIRVRKCLEKTGISSVEKLIQYSPHELIIIKNFGGCSLREVRRKLADYNLCLRENQQKKQVNPVNPVKNNNQ